ncbi:NAD-dependent epimerase/dehydratase family protein [Streptomyces sp. NPDC056600]|uniref:NAD-dependent epimerase/dehydratase family protein n=1 Tax=Streptomyces sp. NPDC056600 TaxID=3345874 RepID=UPI00367E2ACF
MRILVTGATGQVGQGVLRQLPVLAGPGDRVRVLARDETAAAPWAARGAEVVPGDLRDADAVAKAVDGVDAVVNLAAAFKRGEEEGEIRAVNHDAALRLGRLARDAGAGRFVQASTNLVYGAGRDRPHEEDDACVPGGPLWGPYAQSKAEAESALLGLEGLDVRIGRLAFVYGDGDPHLRQSLRWAAHWPSVKRMHLVHVTDAARGLVRLLLAPGPRGRVHNIADDAPVTALDLHRVVGEEFPSGPRPAGDPDPWHGIVSTERLRRELGFVPRYPTVWSARDAGAL